MLDLGSSLSGGVSSNPTSAQVLGFFGGLVVKNSPANTGDTGLISGSERFPGVGNGNPLWYCCLKNPMDREAWQAMVQRVQRVGHDCGTPLQYSCLENPMGGGAW